MNQSAMVSISHSPRGGWKPEEVEMLRTAVVDASQNGEPLRGVFDQIGHALGRKPNSIRNYYYAQLKGLQTENSRRTLPFQTFSESEIRSLLREVLRSRAEGLSVRACVYRMANGDKTRMLRYQNKYRSLLKTRPALVQEIVEELAREGIRCRSPLISRQELSAPSMAQTEARLRESGDPALQQLLFGLNALLSRSSDEEQSLAMERMQVRQDMLHNELNDVRSTYQHLRESCSPLVQSAKDFLGLPADAQKAAIPTFCALLKEQVNALELTLVSARA